MASSHALISNGFLRAKIFVVFIIMIVFSFNAAKLRKNNHNDFIECFKNFIKFILLPKLYWWLMHLGSFLSWIYANIYFSANNSSQVSHHKSVQPACPCEPQTSPRIQQASAKLQNVFENEVFWLNLQTFWEFFIFYRRRSITWKSF